MKTIYLHVLDKGWVSFQYTNISELEEELSKRKIIIGDCCELGDYCKLGNCCELVSSCSTCSRTFKNESILDYYGQCIDNLDTDVNRNMFDVSRDLVKEVEEDRRLCKSDRDIVIGWIFERLENLNEP